MDDSPTQDPLAPNPLTQDSPPLDPSAVDSALAKARQALLGQRVAAGHWEGELSSSALSTATAVVALSAADRQAHAAEVAAGLDWLAGHANADGGWGDSVLSLSNISTTALCWSAFAAAGAEGEPKYREVVGRAGQWIARHAGSLEPAALAAAIYARYGNDRTFSAPILSLCAIAGRLGKGRAGWRYVMQLPFELAVLPHRLLGFLNLRVVSYALPALIAIGLARHRRRPTLNPLAFAARTLLAGPALRVLRRIQPVSGGFLEAAPLTSFVVMNLAAAGQAGHEVARRGVAFLLAGRRADGSWPIDTNLATWNTTLSLNALSASAAPGGRTSFLGECLTPQERSAVLEWLLGQQAGREHPFTHADPGGWAWSDLSGAVPDADDTAGALLALHNLVMASRRSTRPTHVRQGRRLSSHEDGRGLDRHVLDAAHKGLDWLVGLQNRDGGLPTFCRGWGKLPFDRGSNDLTAHALAAMDAWMDELDEGDADASADTAAPVRSVPVRAFFGRRLCSANEDNALRRHYEREAASPQDAPPSRPRRRDSLAGRCENAIRRGVGFLTGRQRLDGAWEPLWFGNQHAPGEENLTYGTARVLMSLQRLVRRWACVDASLIRRGRDWLLANQNGDGGWGGCAGTPSSIEETALAVDALAGATALSPAERAAVARGTVWLIEHTRGGTRFEPSPIGFYFAKLWYFEKLYPIIFTVSALAKAKAALLEA